MNKLLMLIILVIAVSCCPNDNKGYGYSVKASQSAETHPVEVPKKKSYHERFEDHTMHLYDIDGRHCGSIQAYKGEYDGKKWYVFLGSDGRMTVVEDTSKN